MEAKLETVMGRLPTVISCCFCCFLRAGTVMISVFSFFVGLLFAPNVTHTKGFWSMEAVMTNYGQATEMGIHMALGVASIMLCLISLMLMVGSLCNIPLLILVYQWGALVYCIVIALLFIALSVICFFVHDDCLATTGILSFLLIIDVVLSAYFILVVNSLRVSLKFVSYSDYV